VNADSRLVVGAPTQPSAVKTWKSVQLGRCAGLMVVIDFAEACCADGTVAAKVPNRNPLFGA